jgi:hypothetical protein
MLAPLLAAVLAATVLTLTHSLLVLQVGHLQAPPKTLQLPMLM